MLWTVIFYFSLPIGQCEGLMCKYSFQYLASLPCIFMVVTLIQRGNLHNPERVLDGPTPC